LANGAGKNVIFCLLLSVFAVFSTFEVNVILVFVVYLYMYYVHYTMGSDKMRMSYYSHYYSNPKIKLIYHFYVVSVTLISSISYLIKTLM